MGIRYAAERILIRCPNWIGDAIAATGAVRCIRRNYPEAHITLLLEPYVEPVFENAPWFDEMVPFNKEQGRISAVLEATRTLRRRPGYDLAILMTHSFSSALVARLIGARVRVGHSREGRSWLLTAAIRWPATGSDQRLVPKVTVYRSLLEYLGCEDAADQRPEVFTSEEEEAHVDELLRGRHDSEARPLLAIVPGAAYGASKLWKPERFAEVADVLAERYNVQPMILTGPDEGAIGREIASSMNTTPITFADGGLSFGHVKALIRRAGLMICNDTGPRHLAIAYEVPVVVIMGPTDPAVTDSDYRKTLILRQDVPCGPCYRRECPKDHRCMELITTDMVVEAAEDLIERFGFQKAGD